MSKHRSDWYIPGEALGVLCTVLLVPAIAVLAAAIFPVVSALRSGAPFQLYLWGVVFGIFGIIGLVRARWPLYRQRRFWTFGPRRLDRMHRRLYWVAQACILVSTALLIIVWLRTCKCQS